MSDYELDIELLICSMLWDKRDDIYKDRNGRNRLGEKCVLIIKKIRRTKGCL
jgi:hypothetical protein